MTCLRKRAGVSNYEKREIMYIVYYANTKDPDQSAHLHTLIRILTLIIDIFYSNQCFLSYTVKDGAFCLPMFLHHSHNGHFQMLMFI